MRTALGLARIALLLSGILSAQDIAGDWQGTLKIGAAEVRVVINIAKQGDGWSATEFTPDQGSNGVAANRVTLRDSSVSLLFDRIHGAYEGTLSEEKTSMKGTWTQGKSLSLDLKLATEKSSLRRDPTPHHVQFISVDSKVNLEVLDWGGSGRPLVLLSGQNNSAHGFDNFALKLTSAYHVYGITRRGSGASSAPPPTRQNYAAHRLGDDVLSVVDTLKLNRPVLVGHSLAGEELSSVGSRHPEKVAGLVYLDAGYLYAYDPSLSGTSAQSQDAITTIGQAIQAGRQQYTRINVPILAIYALPHERGISDPTARAEADAQDLKVQGAQAKAFEKGLPSARVVWLAHADHYIFQSNEADVLREINTFVSSLP